MKLLIVESPAKAQTIKKYLGNDFEVLASFGHVRDLPSKQGSVVPDENFAMKYMIAEKAAKHIANIMKAAKAATAIYLATDPDREGESISWHIVELIKEKHNKIPDDLFKRIAFNEITKTAVSNAVNNPRKIDINLVNAQQARRALDYLVGFTLSPLLWRKLPGCKSAGRVQSVALRLICEQEEKVENFKVQEYWDIVIEFLNEHKNHFKAKLTHINDTKLDKFYIPNEATAKELAQQLEHHQFQISNIEKKRQKRQPMAPFITSSLQQEAARKLGFSAKKTMQISQKLYEGLEINGAHIGLITYMRTDGVTISTEAVESIRKLIPTMFGKEYLPSAPRQYKSKVKNAQEAHEAIRPTDIQLTPELIVSQLDKDYYKLYDLIWKRTIASQMENVLIDSVAATIVSKNNEYTAKATGSTVAFDGFYRVYRESKDDEEDEEIKMLPPLREKEMLTTQQITPLQHFTEPPPRYSEASLVKKLEELGIGRPSTYASILSVLQDRKYVNLTKKRFIPEELGRLLNTFLVGFFKKYVEYDFTAALETELDEVAAGKLDWKTSLSDFWQGFNANILAIQDKKTTDIIAYLETELDSHLFGYDDTNKSKKQCPVCKTGSLQLKLGKFGAFLACSAYPTCNFKKSITSASPANDNESTDASDTGTTIIGQDVATSTDIYLKKGPYGWYIQLGTQLSKTDKPKRVALPNIIDHRNITIDIAQKLLQLPITLGNHPNTNSKILIGIGKYGPYIKYNNTFISIPKTHNIFEMTLDQAISIIDTDKTKNKKKAK